jgi:hypothetical protein
MVGCCSIIVSVRETCADWQRGVEPQADPALKGKKDPDNGFGIKVPRRNVGGFLAVCHMSLFYFCFIYCILVRYGPLHHSFDYVMYSPLQLLFT